MQNILTVIKATSLFAGLEDNEIKELYTSLRMYPQKFKAGAYIQHIEDTYQCLGLVLSGKVHMISEDIWGNRNLIAEFGQGQFYGESHSLTGTPMFFDIVAAEESELLFINILKCIVLAWQAGAAPQKLLGNLFENMLHKKLSYMRKSDILSRRTIREKLSAYLSNEARSRSALIFTIPYNRQQLADYLAVDRSALSKELAKMQKEGILKFCHNKFELIPVQEGKQEE